MGARRIELSDMLGDIEEDEILLVVIEDDVLFDPAKSVTLGVAAALVEDAELEAEADPDEIDPELIAISRDT